ncbi:LOW QUALITY PROTEIN: uncharacterized protein V1477_015038 [Vespula maculifrons]|uniref:Uncharacterized protein n=1 Tax=Vespula maculifrons TaxID=7453 RepID=A0ABD2BJ63_VESMC
MQQPPSGGTWVDTTGRVSRCLKPTVWRVEQSVSGVLYISSLLRSPKLPKRKGISDLELCVSRFPNAETHGAAILAFGGLNSPGVEVAPLLCFLDSSVVVKSRVTVSPRVSRSSNLHAVGPGSAVLVIYRYLIACKYFRANSCIFEDLAIFSFLCNSKFLSGGTHEWGSWAWASVRVSFFQYRKIQSDVSSNGSVYIRLLDANTGRIERTLARVSAGTGVVFSGAIKSPTPVGPLMQQPPRGGTWVGSTCDKLRSIFELYLKSVTKLHDRSCLEMFEADGVDSGAICKRGFIHLQFAEKPEAPEAERHLGSRILEFPVSPWVPKCSNLHAVGPGSEVLVIHRRLIDCKYYRANGCVLQDFSKIFSITFQQNFEFLLGGSLGMGPWAWASVRVSFLQYRIIELDFRTLVLLGGLCSIASYGYSFLSFLFCFILLTCAHTLVFLSSHLLLLFFSFSSSLLLSLHLSLFFANLDISARDTGRIGRTLARVSAGTGVVFSGAIKSPTSGDPVSPWASNCSNLHAVGPGSEVLVNLQNLMVCKVSIGWDPWEGLMGVGFCAGLLSVPKNPARFPYSRYDRSHSDIHVSVRARLKVLPGTSFYLFGDYLFTPVSRILESRVPLKYTFNYKTQVLPGEWLHISIFLQYLSMKLWSGDTGLPETTTKSSVRPILIVNGSVLLPISTSTHRTSRSTHSLELIEKSQRKYIVISFTLSIFYTIHFVLWGYSPTHDDNISRPTAIGSVLLRISTGTHCGSPSTLSTQVKEQSLCKLICEVGILACEKEQQRRAFDRLLQLLVQLCFGLRRGNLENFANAIPESINEQLIKYINLRSGDTRPREGKTKTGLRPTLTVIRSIVLWTSTRELRKFPGEHSCNILYMGILARERGKQRRAFDRLLQLLGQLCFKLRRGNLENFSVALLAIGILARERGKQRRAFDRLLQLLGQLCFGLRRGNLENFADAIPESINELSIKYTFEFLILTVFCTINLRSGDTRTREGKTKTGLRPTLTVIRSIVLWTSTRELRKFPGEHSCNILYMGILARERGKQTRAFDRLLQLLGQLCFGLRRGNLENFADAIPESINELSIKYTFEFLIFTVFCTINLRSGDTRTREGKTKTGLRPTLTVIRSVVLWTSTRELRKFFDRSSSNILYSLFVSRLICEVGILARERGKQRRAFDRLLQLLGQLCFELRRGYLENFPENIPAIFCTINLRSGDARLRERKTKTGLRPTLTVTIFYFALQDFENLSPQVDLEIVALPINIENLSPRMDLEIFTLPEDFENLSPRMDLEIFAFPLDFENLSPRMDLEIFTLPEDFENLSPRMDLEIFALPEDFDNLSPRMDLEIFTLPEDFENISPRMDLEIFAFLVDFENLSPRMDLEIFVFLVDFENLSPRMDLEIFALPEDFENLSPRMDLEIFAFPEDLENLSPRMDLEIVALPINIENLSPRMDLEIFTLPEDFENLSPRMDLEIFTLPEDFENLSPRMDLEIFTLPEDFENLSPRMDLEIFTLPEDFENLSPRMDLEIFAFPLDFENLSPRMDLEIFALPEDFENLSPRMDLEIFTLPEDFENLSPRMDLEIFTLPEDFENLSPRMDLEIFTLPEDFENLSPRMDLEIFAFPLDFENLSPRMDLEIFALPEDFENLSPRMDLEIFTLPEDFENLSPRMDLEIFTLPEDFENLSPRMDLEIFAFPLDFENLSPRMDLEIFAFPLDFANLSPRMDLEIFTLPEDFENLSPRMDLEIFAFLVDFENLSPRMDLEIFAFLVDFENLSPRMDLEIFTLPEDFDNLSPRVDLEIFAFLVDFENLSPRMDLEIFGFPEDFENLSPRVDLEIFTNVIRAKPHCNRARSNECITEEDLDQLRCRPTSFSTNYESSTLNFDLNRGPVFWSHRRTSQVNSSKMALSHNLILPCYTTGRVSRCLKPTVWTVEQSVSGVLYISTRSSRSGKASRFADFRVDSPLARGSQSAATSTRWDLGRHDRSCLEMFEADGVDSGAICKRGFIHLQFAEKPEAPEAERHLGSRILEFPVSPWVPKCSNLHAVGPGSEVLVIHRRLIDCKYYRANGCVLQDFSKIFSITFQQNFEFLSGGSLGMGPWAWASVRVSFLQYRIIELDFRTLVLLEGLCSTASYGYSFLSFLFCFILLTCAHTLVFLSSHLLLLFFSFSSSLLLSLHLSLFFANLDISARDTGRIGRTLARVSAGTERRLFDHAGHAKFRVETPLARGSPTAATSTRWDLGRNITERMAAFFKSSLKFLLCNTKFNIEGHTFYILSYSFRIFSSKFTFIEKHSYLIIEIIIGDKLLEFLSGGTHGKGSWAWASVRVSFQYRKIQLDFRTLVMIGFNVSSNGLFHIRLLDGNTGKIERTFARVSAGTGVVFPGAIKSPTIMDFSHSDIHVSVRARLKVLPGTSFYLFGDYLFTPVSRILESRVPLGDRWTYLRGIFTRKHDRSCLEMFEADGVDSGAICKRGFIHLQFAEKPEAPEAERHLGSRILDGDRSFRCWIVELCVSRFPNAETHGAAILAFGGLNSPGVEVAPLLCFFDNKVVKSRVIVSPRVSRSSNLHAVGPGSAVLVIYRYLIACKYFRANSCIFKDLAIFSFLCNSKFLSGGTHEWGSWAWASVRVSFFQSDVSSNGSVYIRLLDANTGRIERTLARVSAGTGVVFSGAIKSPTPVGPQMQQPPRGGTWVGSTCDKLRSIFELYLKSVTKFASTTGRIAAYFNAFPKSLFCLILSRHTTGRVSRCLKPTVWTVEQSPVGPEVQQPPRGGTWVGSTCDTSKTHRLQVLPSEWLRSSRFFQDFLYHIPTKFRISVGWVPWDGPLGVGFCAGLLPSVPNNRAGFSYSGFARSRDPVSPWVSNCSNLHAVGPGSEVLVNLQNLMACKLIIRVSIGWDPWEGLMGVGFCAGLLSVPKNPARFPYSHANTGKIERTFARVSAGTGVVFPGAIKSPTIMDFSHSDIHVSVRARLKVLPGTSFYLFGDYLFTPVSRILESRVPLNYTFNYKTQVLPGEWLHIFIFLQYLSHDRSCLEMFEADGVDSGAICKRGFIHLQFAEKPEAPEAERHLGSWILDRFPNAETHGAAILAFGGLNSPGVEVAPLLCFLDSSVVVKSRVTVSPRVSRCSNLHAVGPGSAVLVIYRYLIACKYFRANSCIFEDLAIFSFLCNSKFLSGGTHEWGSWAWASVRVSFFQSDVSSNGSVYIRLLDANTGRIERTLARVSAGTGVVFSGAIKSPTSYRGLRFIERRLFDHAGHAKFKVESPLARGSPDAAASTRWDLGRYFYRVGPMGRAHGRGLLCGSPFSTEKSSSISVLSFNVSSNGLFHIRLLDANTGKIERTFARVSAGTGVVFPGAIKSPTIMDFSFGHSRECPSAIKSPTGDFVLFVRRLFVHAGLADLRE